MKSAGLASGCHFGVNRPESILGIVWGFMDLRLTKGSSRFVTEGILLKLLSYGVTVSLDDYTS